MPTRTTRTPPPDGRASAAASQPADQGHPHAPADLWLHRAMAAWVRTDPLHPAPSTPRRNAGPTT